MYSKREATGEKERLKLMVQRKKQLSNETWGETEASFGVRMVSSASSVGEMMRLKKGKEEGVMKLGPSGAKSSHCPEPASGVLIPA